MQIKHPASGDSSHQNTAPIAMLPSASLAELRRLRAELGAARDELQAATELLERVARDTEEKSSLIAQLRQELQREQSAREQAVRAHDELERAAQIGREHAKNAEWLWEQRNGLLARVAHLEESLERSSTDAAVLRAQIEDLRAEIVTLQYALAAAESLNQEGSTRAQALEDQLEHAETLRAQLQFDADRFEQIQQENRELQKRLIHGARDLARASAAHGAEVRSLAEQRAKLFLRIDNLEADLSERNQELLEAQAARALAEHALATRHSSAETAQARFTAVLSRLQRRIHVLNECVEAQTAAAKESDKAERALLVDLQEQAGRVALLERDVRRKTEHMQRLEAAIAQATSQGVEQQMRFNAMQTELRELQSRYGALYDRSVQIARQLAEATHELSVERGAKAEQSAEIDDWVLECERLLRIQDGQLASIAALHSEIAASGAEHERVLRREAAAKAELTAKLQAVTSQRDQTMAASKDAHGRIESLTTQLVTERERYERELQNARERSERELQGERERSARELQNERSRAAQQIQIYERRLADITEKFREFAEGQHTRTRADIAAVSSAIERVQGGRIWQLKLFVHRLFRNRYRTEEI